MPMTRAPSSHQECTTQLKHRWASSTSCWSKSLTRFNSAPPIPTIRKCRRLSVYSASTDAQRCRRRTQLVIAQLAFANSDLAFQGNHLFQGNFYGVNIFDISNPAKTTLLTSMVCPGGQGDPSVYKNLLFMSVEMPNGRLDCGTQGFPPEPASHPPDKLRSAEKKTARRQRKKIVSEASGFSILPTSRIRSRWLQCKLAAARTRIRWSSIRMIRTTFTSTFPEPLSSVKAKSWPVLG